MGVVLCAGTSKGAAFLRSDARRERWEVSPLQLKGWMVTAAARDTAGRTYVAVASDVYGAAVLSSDNLEDWEQLEGAPRYAPGERGNAIHSLIVGSAGPGQLDRYRAGSRYVDQIWTLHAAGDVLYAGVSEAGLFRSDRSRDCVCRPWVAQELLGRATGLRSARHQSRTPAPGRMLI